MSESEQLNELIRDNIEKLLPMICKQYGLVQRKLARVATVGAISATVCFATDLSTESSVSFKNKSGETLVHDDWVYIESTYGDTDQGFIAYKK